MSVLPILGHKPITSYFSRTSSAKRKRQQVHKATEGIPKRPRQSAGPSFPSASREDIADGLNRVTPCTPVSQKQSFGSALPTPPLTCIAPPRPRKGPLPAVPSPPPNGTTASFLVVTPIVSEFTVPSSQSQDCYPSTEIDILNSFSGNPSLLRPTEGEDLIIESSQSQLLSIVSPIMRKLDLEPTLPAFNVVIPSSQSQEEELTLPTETRARARYLSGAAQRGQRTLSEELFSVPIQESILDNLFSDKQAPGVSPGNSPDSGNPKTLAKDESEGLRNSFDEERSLEPTSWIPAARASSDSQSYSSLPPEVWEFRKMFENGDESYPADFPESLRS